MKYRRIEEYSAKDVRFAAEVCMAFSDQCARTLVGNIEQFGVTSKETINAHDHMQHANATSVALQRVADMWEEAPGP